MTTINRKDKGVYVLIIRCDRDKVIKVGALGDVHFKKGYYAYIGSAMNGLEGRIKRHLLPPGKKKIHWHIDYLMGECEVVDVYFKVVGKKQECEVANRLKNLGEGIPGFGCSDCKCGSHLSFSKRKKDFVDALRGDGFRYYFDG